MNRCPRPETTRALSAQNGRPPNVPRESWTRAGATATRSAMGSLRGYTQKDRAYRAARSAVHNIGPPTCLGDAVKETHCSRREFLGMSAAAAGASLAAHSMVPLPRNLIPAAVAASERVRFGMVGVGMQGNW